jgi:hypothetical protein
MVCESPIAHPNDIMLILHRRHLLCLRVRQCIATTRWHTNNHRPVIVAENMIGVAMYELVCGMHPTNV